MTRPSYLLLVLACVFFTCYSAQKSCRGRCGEAYYRGNVCQCDNECLSHNECCRNYESLCTTRESCKGRCGERFKRGRICHCDIACVQYDQCCPDYESVCTIEESSLDEESDDAELDPQDDLAAQDINYPEAEDPVVVGASPTLAVVSGNGALSSGSPEDVQLNPTAVQPSAPPDLPDVEPELSAAMKRAAEEAEAEGVMPPLPVTQPPISSFLSPASSTSAEPPDNNRFSVTEEEQGSPAPESEQPSPNSTASPPELVPTRPATAQCSQDPPAAARQAKTSSTPASEGPQQNTQPESRASPTTTVHTDNTEITASNSTSEREPSDPEQPKDTLTPEGAPRAQEEHAEPPENMHSKAVKIQNNEPTDKPSSTEMTTNPQDEDLKDLPSPKEDKAEPTGPPTGPEGRPSNPDQPGEGAPPEDKPHRLHDPSEPSENTPSAGLQTKYAGSTVKPNFAETTTHAIDELSSAKEASPTLTSLESTTASVKESPSPTKAIEKPNKPKSVEALNEESPWDYQADASNDTDLCSGRPVNGLTTLRNGTIVAFRGHYFWTLDSRRKPGPAQGITDVWGIPSPIDTVYTRCNCQGKTYFFKGNSYWRFENGIMDPGFPKTISEGFGLGGQITAALSMPRYRSRRESVLFFKRGGLAQRYTYRITPQCGSKLAIYTTNRRVRRAEDPELGQEINIRSWRSFPPLVTSALSVPTTGGDGYKYYVFSPTKYYSLKMEGDAPVILTPKEGAGRQSSARTWFRCPETPKM